jgi:hypothetical protein
MLIGTEVPRLDKRDKAILHYIKEHSGTTENEIVNALVKQKISSKLTTLKKIRELKEKNEITDSLKEGQSGFHHYFINENNEYYRIDKAITEVESILDSFESIVGRLENNTLKISDPGKTPIIDVDAFMVSYGEAIQYGLHSLLVHIYRRVHSQKDSQILYTRVMDLMIKVGQLLSHQRGDKMIDIESYIDNLKLIMRPDKKTLTFEKSKLRRMLELFPGFVKVSDFDTQSLYQRD